MTYDCYDEDESGIEYQEPIRKVDIKKSLTLDNIMVLRIGPEDSYMISIYGIKKWDCDDRILLTNVNQREKTIIDQCLRENLELERKSIVHYMKSDKIKMYNKALNIGEYDICTTMLLNLEYDLNEMSKEINKERIIKKRGEIK